MTGCRETTTDIGLSRWRFILPGVLLWMVSVSSAAQSATLQATFTLPAPNFEFVTTGNLGNDSPVYFGLNVDSGLDLFTTVTNVSAQPKNTTHTVTYTLNKVSSLADFVNDIGTSDFIVSGVGGLSSLLLAGKQYVLSIDCSTCSNARTGINTSAVPLPAAAWLFGSALVGFIMMSNRRSV